MDWGDIMQKLLFITWSVSYGYGTEKSLAAVLNKFDDSKYDISILPLFKYSNDSIFNCNIKILDPIIDYTNSELDKAEELKNITVCLQIHFFLTSGYEKNMIVL